MSVQGHDASGAGQQQQQLPCPYCRTDSLDDFVVVSAQSSIEPASVNDSEDLAAADTSSNILVAQIRAPVAKIQQLGAKLKSQNDLLENQVRIAAAAAAAASANQQPALLPTSSHSSGTPSSLEYVSCKASECRLDIACSHLTVPASQTADDNRLAVLENRLNRAETDKENYRLLVESLETRIRQLESHQEQLESRLARQALAHSEEIAVFQLQLAVYQADFKEERASSVR